MVSRVTKHRRRLGLGQYMFKGKAESTSSSKLKTFRSGSNISALTPSAFAPARKVPSPSRRATRSSARARSQKLFLSFQLVGEWYKRNYNLAYKIDKIVESEYVAWSELDEQAAVSVGGRVAALCLDEDVDSMDVDGGAAEGDGQNGDHLAVLFGLFGEGPESMDVDGMVEEDDGQEEEQTVKIKIEPGTEMDTSTGGSEDDVIFCRSRPVRADASEDEVIVTSERRVRVDASVDQVIMPDAPASIDASEDAEMTGTEQERTTFAIPSPQDLATLFEPRVEKGTRYTKPITRNRALERSSLNEERDSKISRPNNYLPPAQQHLNIASAVPAWVSLASSMIEPMRDIVEFAFSTVVTQYVMPIFSALSFPPGAWEM